MKVPFQSLAVLAQVVKVGDVKVAAEILCTTVSNVNFHLKKIENQIGETVLYRRENRLAVKPKYESEISGIINKISGIENDYSKLTDGSININLCSDISFNILYLERKISTFLETYPAYKINMLSKNLLEVDSYSDADIVITYDDSLTMYQHRIPLVKERFFFAATRKYLNEHPSIKNLKDLNGHAFLEVMSRKKNDSYPKIKSDHPNLQGRFVYYDLSYPAIESAKLGNGICYASELMLYRYILSGELEYLDLGINGREFGRYIYFNDTHKEIVDQFCQLFFSA